MKALSLSGDKSILDFPFIICYYIICLTKSLVERIPMKIISIIQVIVSVALMISILLQNRGSGLSAAFGGDFGGYYTKRGMEKFLFYFSIGASTLFLILAAANIIIANK